METKKRKRCSSLTTIPGDINYSVLQYFNVIFQPINKFLHLRSLLHLSHTCKGLHDSNYFIQFLQWKKWYYDEYKVFGIDDKDHVNKHIVTLLHVEFKDEDDIPKLPPNIKNISLNLFDVEKINLNFIPKKLTELDFGPSFNQPIEPGILPETLKILTFRLDFNQRLAVGIFPHSLQTLKFGPNFNQKLEIGVLPESLEFLRFGRLFNQVLNIGVLPQGLKILYLGKSYSQQIPLGALPTDLKHFKIRHAFLISGGILPPNLEYLSSIEDFHPLFTPSTLPMTLTDLCFGFAFNWELAVGILPPNLVNLEFRGSFNQVLKPGVLPRKLQSLKFGRYFNQPLQLGALPFSLTVLEFGTQWNQAIIFPFPPNLKLLYFGENFNQFILPGILSPNLLRLEFGKHFNQPILLGALPPTLKHLLFGKHFNHSLPSGVLPESLKTLSIDGPNKSDIVLPGNLQFYPKFSKLVDDRPYLIGFTAK